MNIGRCFVRASTLSVAIISLALSVSAESKTDWQHALLGFVFLIMFVRLLEADVSSD